jgi:hypothetical protein
MKHLKMIFTKNNPITQNKIYKDFLYKRDRQNEKEKTCYCGHTIDCDCENPSFDMFKEHVLNNNITEKTLN